jgi:hypothetical protein
MAKLNGRYRVDYGHSGGRGELECCRGQGYVCLFAGEDEAGYGAVGFPDLDRGDGAFCRDGEGEALYALVLTGGYTREGEGAVGGWG